MSLWTNIWRDDAKDWVYTQLQGSQVPDAVSGTPVQSGSDYLSITLKSMRVCDVRRGWTKFYGLTQSYVSLPTLDGRIAEIATVVSPDELKKVDDSHVDRVIQVNAPLLEEVAYNGGSVELELGLFSVKEADLAAPFLTLLQSIADKAGVSFLSTIAPFFEPFKKGIESLSGTNDAVSLEVGLATAFKPLSTGWFVVMRAPRDSVDITKLKVTPHDFRLVDSKGAPVGRYPYMVFTIAAASRKSNWFAIPEIASVYRELRDAVRRGDYEDSKELVGQFRRTAMSSVDLHQADAVQIAEQVKTATEAVLGGGLTSAGKGPGLPPLNTFSLKR